MKKLEDIINYHIVQQILTQKTINNKLKIPIQSVQTQLK